MATDVDLAYMGNGKANPPTDLFEFRDFRFMTGDIVAEDSDWYATPEGDQDTYIVSYTFERRVGTAVVIDGTPSAASDYPLFKVEEIANFIQKNPTNLYRLRVRYKKNDDNTYIEKFGRITSFNYDARESEMVTKIQVDFSFWEDTID